ncbi:MAG: CPBP family intramembrane glutamic endopeptidase [Candidatus Diapherotrites archaeon]
MDAFLIGFPILYIKRKKKLNIKKELSLNFFGKKDFALKTTELLLLLIIISIMINVALTILSLNDMAKVTQKISVTAPILLAYLFIVRVTAEEWFFRGFLVKQIGVMGSSIAFAAVHVFYFSVAEVIGAFLLGLVLAHYFKKNNTLYPNIIAHIAYNLFTFFF